MTRWISACAAALTIVAGTGVAVEAQTAAEHAPSADYGFPTGAGMLLFHVHPDRATDFEDVVARLSHALDTATDPVRRQQAASWHIFRSLEGSSDDAVYLFVFDPAVPQADYDPVQVLGEAAPRDVQGLYDRLRADVIRVERISLARMR